MRTKATNKHINVVTLGCSKNIVDSEELMKQLQVNELVVEHNSELNNADTVIINTCGFIKDAKEQSVNTILQFAKSKKKGDIKNLYVMGCLSERYKTDLEKEISEVDRYFGTNDLKKIIETLGYNYKEHLTGERIVSTPKHYAYLKISEGCDRQCSFCAIPIMRGKHKSKTIEQVINEAKCLVNSGAKEIILIAQELTYYGIDLYKKQKLAELLNMLSDLEGIQWIRLHYAYPSGFPKEILQVIRNKPNICNYLDIPFQHISDNVLKKMRRQITNKATYDLIQNFRDDIPDLTLRTTLMVGHPGENEKEFEELVNFVENIRFNRLGVFTYSEEEDTFGARNYPDKISEITKIERSEKIMQLQSSISLQHNKSKIGNVVKVLIDRNEGSYFIGRTEADSPEIDNEVLVSGDKNLKIGEFYNVEVTSAEEYDLFAKRIAKI
jgi:ribosomal protein S12 methylthiotransferase